MTSVALGPADECLLGIDIGTASSKGVVATTAGSVIATATVSHSVSYPNPGRAEMDAETVWWQEVASLCRQLVAQVRPSHISAVCVSGIGPCLLLCDKDERPTRPAILYGIDMRATAEIEELTNAYGAAQIVKRGGTALSSQAVGPKMLWVRRHDADSWARSTRWYNSHSFVVARLTGEYVLDHHTASQCDPLYDMRHRDWSRDWTDDIAVGLQLPRLVYPSEVVGVVHSEAATETNLAEGTQVCAGTVDAWAEAFSAGVRHPGDLMLMYGSTMFFVQVVPELRTHPLLWATAGVEPRSHTVAAGMATSGSLTTWIQELTGGIPYEQMVAEAAVTPPGADGLLVLPYFAGERTPVFDPKARGVVAGLTLRHTRGHLYRAVYEGIGCGVRQILELFRESAGVAHRIIAVGGGTQNPLWMQIVSDITGRRQLLPRETIGASYGDALLAGIGTGRVDEGTDWARLEESVTPEPATSTVYEQLFANYEDLYPATRELVHRLATF